MRKDGVRDRTDSSESAHTSAHLYYTKDVLVMQELFWRLRVPFRPDLWQCSQEYLYSCRRLRRSSKRSCQRRLHSQSMPEWQASQRCYRSMHRGQQLLDNFEYHHRPQGLPTNQLSKGH